MNDTAQIITSLATLLGVIGSFILNWYSAKTLGANTRKLDEVHTATNGLTEKLIDASKAEGNLIGRAQLKSEQTTRRRK